MSDKAPKITIRPHATGPKHPTRIMGYGYRADLLSFHQPPTGVTPTYPLAAS